MEYQQRTGRRIKFNHSNALPRYILSVSVDKIKEPSSISDDSFYYRFGSCSIVTGRLVDKRLQGIVRLHLTNRDMLWQHIYSFTRPNYTTWLVGYGILTDLILCGLPDRFHRSELFIDKPRSKRTREDNDEDNSHAQALAVLESPPTIIGCRVASTQGRLVIVDCLNWFPGELATLKAAHKLATAAESDRCDANAQEFPASYSTADTVLRTFERLIRWVGENEMGMFRYTASSQAFGAYRHRFMKHAIYCHDNLPVTKQERKAYYGGRSEVFKMGAFDTTIYHLDANALFPYVMREGHFPHYLHRYEQREEPIALLPAIDYSASVAEVELDTKDNVYPVRTDTHVIFPTGALRTVLCGTELYRAFKSGCIRKVGSWSEYKLAPLFTTWVDELWQMRMNYKAANNPLYEQFTKRIMNSLYGKFAQLTPAWINEPADYSMEPFTTESRYDCTSNQWTTYRSVGWQVQKLCSRIEKPGSFYAISAFVTAAARTYMDNLRKTAGNRNVYYQGVDSLMVNKMGLDNLTWGGFISDTLLGKMKVVHTADYGCIRGISDYEIGSHVVLSSRALHSEVSEAGDVVQHKYYVMKHLFKNGPTDRIEERLEQWNRQNKYGKGIVQPDGWVEPFYTDAAINSPSVGSN